MQDILEFIKKHPNVVTESRDDANCRLLLASLGLIEALDASTKAAEPNFSVLVSDDHLTHWIVALRWSGYPEQDNGCQVFALPKHLTNERRVRDFVDFIHQKYQGHDHREIVSWPLHGLDP